MKRIISLLIILITIIACGVTKPTLPPATDTTVVHVIDSVAWHDSTLFHHVYKEIYNDYADLLDTLNMSTTYSDFSAWVDTTSNKLKGTATNKDINIPVQIKWKEKIVYKDSIQVVREPYPVEVEKIKYRHTFWDKLAWLISGLSISILVIYIVHKLYGTKGKLL